MVSFDKKQKISFSVCIIVLTVLLGLNIYFLKENIQNQKKYKAKAVNSRALTKRDSKKNCSLILETKYKKCGHIITEYKKIDSSKYDCIADIEKDYRGYEVTLFSSDKIIMNREVNGLCPEHYIIKDHDGYVTVYWEQKDGKDYKIKEITNIRVKTLSLQEQQMLQSGIKAYKEELFQRLEDLSS